MQSQFVWLTTTISAVEMCGTLPDWIPAPCWWTRVMIHATPAGKNKSNAWVNIMWTNINAWARKSRLSHVYSAVEVALSRIRAFASLSRSRYLSFCPLSFSSCYPGLWSARGISTPWPPFWSMLTSRGEEGRSQQNKRTWGVSAKCARWRDDARLSLCEHLVTHPCSSACWC